MDRDHPLICPYYINSKMFVQGDTVGVKMVPSTALRTKADRVIDHPVSPRELREFCGEVCPYELMMHAARNTDVIILNYHHLFDRDIREQLYASLGVEPHDILLLIDEAHNCGDVITSIESVTLEERDLEQASRELSGMRKRHKGADAVQHVLPRLTEFIHGLGNSGEVEDWFDPSIFDRMVVRESLYKNMEEIVDDLIGLAGSIREKNLKAGEYRETAIERLTEFLLGSRSQQQILPFSRYTGKKRTESLLKCAISIPLYHCRKSALRMPAVSLSRVPFHPSTVSPVITSGTP
jgi:DNA excision repair protein ERCC-2